MHDCEQGLRRGSLSAVDTMVCCSSPFPLPSFPPSRSHAVDFLLLAGFLKLLPSSVVSAFPRAILNVHPALLPAFGGKGFFGMRVHEAVIRSGARWGESREEGRNRCGDHQAEGAETCLILALLLSLLPCQRQAASLLVSLPPCPPAPRVSGPTVHFVDERYDTGPIVAQRVVPVLPDDSPQTLQQRVLEQVGRRRGADRVSD